MQRDSPTLDIWGCRGSRSLPAGTSTVGNLTSCYSLTVGDDVIVFDAGRGLTVLSHEILTESRFASVRRVHILITHGHMDHWEGLKDADWLWAADTKLELTLYGVPEALAAIESAHEPPSFVRLDILALGSLKNISVVELSAGEKRTIGGCEVRTHPLHHYSGIGDNRRYLDTLGYRVDVPGGPGVAYLCDHEPTPDTEEVERRLTAGAAAALYDTHFIDIKDQTFGHGSHEHAAEVARRTPETIILATHHGTALADHEIEDAHRRHGRGLANYRIAREGDSYRWNGPDERFELAG